MPATKTNKISPIGEVVSASITGIVAETLKQADSLDGSTLIRPSFGSFVRAEASDDASHDKLDVYLVVFNVLTGPQDSVHKPQALGLSREQLRAEQPHIFSLLRTEIHAQTVGFKSNEEYCQFLPPYSAQVHDFIFSATDEEIIAITEDLDFLRLVASVSSVPVDELLTACIREAYRARENDYQFLIEAGQALSHLFRDDYDRLVSVLRKIKPQV